MNGHQYLELLKRVKEVTKLLHNSPRTEAAYAQWIEDYIFFHGRRHPAKMGETEVTAFLVHLIHRKIPVPIQKQALKALIFLYDWVLAKPLNHPPSITPSRQSCPLSAIQNHKEIIHSGGTSTKF